jgi:hypothetical protein
VWKDSAETMAARPQIAFFTLNLHEVFVFQLFKVMGAEMLNKSTPEETDVTFPKSPDIFDISINV